MYPKSYSVTVLTREFNRKDIEGEEPLGVDFLYFDLPFFSKKDHYWRFIKIYYLVWQLFAVFYVLYVQVSRNFRYDIIHHVTYNNIDVCGFLWCLKGSDFIWGPVGGGQTPPKNLKRLYYRSWRKQKLRNFLKSLASYNPITLLAIKKSRFVMYANNETKDRFSHITHKSFNFLETGYTVQPDVNGKLLPLTPFRKLLWVGRLEERKGFILLMDVIDRLVSIGVDVHVDVVGTGEDLDLYKLWVRERGLSDNIFLKGAVAFNEVHQCYLSASLFLFTSAQDTSGNVMLEALGHGVPVVALNHQGAAEIIDDKCGVLVNLAEYEEIVNVYSDAILSIFKDSLRYESLSSGAVRRIKSLYTWESRQARFESFLAEAGL